MAIGGKGNGKAGRRNGNGHRKANGNGQKNGRSRRRATPPICGAKNRSGGPCLRHPTPGSRRCHYHGGAKAKIPRGDPRQGGRKPTTGLYVRHLKPEQLEAHEMAKATVGSLDEELALARANLDWAVKRWSGRPGGGVLVEKGRVTKIRLYADVVLEHIDRIRALEKARAEILKVAPPESRDLKTYEVWVQAQAELEAKAMKEQGEVDE